MTRKITEKGDGVVLVLSAAVLVIVIDARVVGRAGMAREGLTRSREGREGLLGDGARGLWTTKNTNPTKAEMANPPSGKALAETFLIALLSTHYSPPTNPNHQRGGFC